MDDDQDLIETIETERLRLRSPRAADAAAFAASLTPEVTMWLNSWPAEVSVELAAQRIETMRARLTENRNLESREFLSFMIERRSDARLLGGIGAMVKPEHPERAEIGYHLDPDHHGQGYVVEAAKALIEAIWRLTDVSSVAAAANLANAPSFKVMERLGMTPTIEQAIYSPGRDVWEMCRYYELKRPSPTA